MHLVLSIIILNNLKPEASDNNAPSGHMYLHQARFTYKIEKMIEKMKNVTPIVIQLLPNRNGIRA
jgi:hypothetical protein